MAMRKAHEIPSFISDVLPYSLGTQSTNGFACQGGCVVDNNWYMLTTTQDNATQYLYKLDLETNVFTLCATYTELKHANGLTFNPNTNELLVAPMDGSNIIAVDISDYSISRTITAVLPDGGYHLAIAFDRKRNLIYSWRGSNIYVFSANGNYIKTITLNNYVTHSTTQDMETDGDFVYLLWSKGPSYIDVYTVAGDFVATQTTTGFSEEFESIGYNWNGYFFMQSFYVNEGNQRVYSLLNRTFDGWANNAFTPLVFGGKREQNGTITITGINSASFSSSGSKNYNTVIYGCGFGFGYSALIGKKLKISYDTERVNGSSGQIGVSIFTTDRRTPNQSSYRLFQKSHYHSIPQSGIDHYEKEIVIGTDFIPDSGKEGTYLGYWLFLYADSGNSCKVTNFRIDVAM